MKSGASDPFEDDAVNGADGPGEEQPKESDSEGVGDDEGGGSVEGAESVKGGESSGLDEEEERTEAGEVVADASKPEEDEDAGSDAEFDRSQIPWTLRRDAVKDDRPHVHQLFVREDTDGKARRAESRLEEVLDTDVYRLDAREAIYLVGMQHIDEAAELLEEWGYNF